MCDLDKHSNKNIIYKILLNQYLFFSYMEDLYGALQLLERDMDTVWGVKWERQPENLSKVKLMQILTFQVYLQKKNPNKTKQTQTKKPKQNQ